MATIGYLRVSTDEQAQSGLGLDAQLEAIRRTFGEPDAVFRDEGISGAKANRPGLMDALNALGAGDVLAVAKRDRLARDTFYSLWIEKEAKRRGASIVSAAGEGNGDAPTDVLMRTIVNAFAEYERNLIGARTAAALEQKRKRGEFTGGDVPYGFDLGTDGVRLTQDEAEAEAVELMLELKDRGYSLRQICDELRERGVETKRGGGRWHPTVVSRILKRAA